MWHYKIYANNAPLMDSGKISGHEGYHSGTDATLGAEAVCEAIAVSTLEISVYAVGDNAKFAISEFKAFLAALPPLVATKDISKHLTAENISKSNEPQVDEDPDQKAAYIEYVQSCDTNGFPAISYADFCNLECATV